MPDINGSNFVNLAAGNLGHHCAVAYNIYVSVGGLFTNLVTPKSLNISELNANVLKSISFCTPALCL